MNEPPRSLGRNYMQAQMVYTWRWPQNVLIERVSAQAQPLHPAPTDNPDKFNGQKVQIAANLYAWGLLNVKSDLITD